MPRRPTLPRRRKKFQRLRLARFATGSVLRGAAFGLLASAIVNTAAAAALLTGLRQEALSGVAAQSADQRQLFGLLDALGHRLQSELLRQRHHRAPDALHVVVRFDAAYDEPRS